MTYSVMNLLVMWMTTLSCASANWDDAACERPGDLSNVAHVLEGSELKDSGLLLGDNRGRMAPLLGIEAPEYGKSLRYASRMSPKRHSDAGPAYAAAGQIAGRQEVQKAAVWVVERFEGEDIVMESGNGAFRVPREAFPGVSEGAVIEWQVNVGDGERRLAMAKSRIERMQMESISNL